MEGELASKVQYLQLSGITHDPAAPVPSNVLLFVLTPTQELIKNENEFSEADVTNFQRSIKATLATLSQFEIVLLQVMSWWTSALMVQ